ncbi:MAG: Hpt domain-containing protein [Bdellovibrionales bacterium]|nr:Hpt domain-containing protein [Bdellovibrionales bacterium]
MDDFERELKIGFLEEATAGLADAEQCFLELENNPSDMDNLNKIFRLAHNLKGSSKAVGFAEMGDFTHEFETFILMIKNGELKPTSAIVGLLLNCNDHLAKWLKVLRSILMRNLTLQRCLLR